MKKINNTSNSSTNVVLRVGFSSILEGYEQQKESIESVIKEYAFSDEKSTDKLWKMTYSKEKGLKAIGLIAEEASEEDIQHYSDEFVKELREEMKYQHRKHDRRFMIRNVPESCKATFNELLKETDAVVAVTIYDKCYKLAKNSDSNAVNRCLNLLSSKDEKKTYGGIRSLYFGKEEAEFLKPYTKLIKNLLNLVWKERNKSNVYDECSYKPFENLGEMITQQQESEPVETSVEKNKEEIDSAKVITAAVIEADSKVFRSFINACKKITKAGYDINDVVSRVEEIQTVLDVSKKLNG